MESRPPLLLDFGPFALDLALSELRRDGAKVPLEPKAIDLLQYLIAHRERLVSPEELRENVWQGTAVGMHAVRRTIRLLRIALDDDVRAPRWLSTVPRRGYRFIGEVKGRRAAAPVQLEAPAALDYRRLFVGRGEERSLWSGALARARSGEGSLLLIEGEAGIGKSRLLECCAEQAHASGVLPIASQCREDEGAPPLWPWVQAIRQLTTSATSRGSQAALRRAAPGLAQLFPSLQPLRREERSGWASDPRALRFQAYEAMRDLLHELSRETPLALLFDDLHRADASSLALFEFLAAQLATAGIVFAGSMRPEGSERPELANLARGARCRTLHLEGLQVEDVRELLASAAPGRDTPELAHGIWQQTAGNAFFVHQVLPLANRIAAAGSLARALPQTVRRAIEQQCDALSAETQVVIRSAAVFGREFPVRLLAEALDIVASSAMEAIDEATRARLLLEIPERPLHYRYAHLLVRDVLYEAIGSEERARLHGRVGSVLESACSDTTQLAAELAHHFHCEGTRAGHQKAARYHGQAGDVAAKRFDHAASIRHYRAALALIESLPASDPIASCDLRLHLARELHYSGLLEAAGTEWLAAADLARATGDVRRLTHVALELSSGFDAYPYPMEPRAAAALLADVADASAEAGTTERARLLARLAYIHGIAHATEAAEQASAQALRLVKETGDPIALAEVLACEHSRRLGTPAVLERLEIARQLIRCVEGVGRPTLELNFLVFLAADLSELGRFDEWEAVVASHRRLAERLRSPQHIALSHRNRAMRALVRGEFEEARALGMQALSLVQHCDPQLGRELLAILANVQYETVGASPQVIEQIMSIGDATNGLVAELWVLPQMQRPDLVRQRIGAGLAVMRSGFRSFNTPSFACSLAQAVAYVGDTRLAEEALGWLHGFEELHAVGGIGGVYLGPCLRYIGLLHGTLGRWEESIAALEEALQRMHAIWSPPWEARLHLDLADVCARRSDLDARERAVAHAHEALRIGEQLRMPLIERRARQLAGA